MEHIIKAFVAACENLHASHLDGEYGSDVSSYFNKDGKEVSSTGENAGIYYAASTKHKAVEITGEDGTFAGVSFHSVPHVTFKVGTDLSEKAAAANSLAAAIRKNRAEAAKEAKRAELERQLKELS